MELDFQTDLAYSSSPFAPFRSCLLCDTKNNFSSHSFRLLSESVSIRLKSNFKMPIIFDCCGKVEEAQKNAYPKVGKEICAAHVETVWCKVSDFVETQMGVVGRGVRIPGNLLVQEDFN